MVILLSANLLLFGMGVPVYASDTGGKRVLIGGGTPFVYYFGLSGALCDALNNFGMEGPRRLGFAVGVARRA